MLSGAALSGLRKARILHHVVHSSFPSHIYAQTVLFKGHKRSPSVGRSISGSLYWLTEIDGLEANTNTDSKTSRS